MSKVYCKNCKYLLYDRFVAKNYCTKDTKEYDTYYNHNIIFITASEKNKKNDCKDFVAKKHWWN